MQHYIELHAYQDALVRKGLEEVREGRVVSHEDVLNKLKKTKPNNAEGAPGSRPLLGDNLGSRGSTPEVCLEGEQFCMCKPAAPGA